MEVVTFRVNVVVVGLVIFDVVVDSLLDVDDTRLAFFNVVVDFCEDFVHGGSDVRVNVVVVGLVIFDVVVDSFLDVDDARLALFNVVVDFCEDFVHGGSDVFDVAVDPCADVVDVCCS